MDKKNNKRVGQNIKIKKYDDIFENLEQNISDNSKSEIYVDPAYLRDFNGHPFKVVGKGIDELMDSIREHGILSPILVRPVDGLSNTYEIISGHRRKYCAVELGLKTVPVIIRDIDDDEAVLAMVDSNIQREDILPSEKAFAYKMKLEAIKRQGERRDLTSGQVVQKLNSSDEIGKENNESGRQIRRYVRLTELPAVLLEAIDNKKMSFNAGVELSFLNEDEKKAVENAAKEAHKFPSLGQAKKLREMSGNLSEVTPEEIIKIFEKNNTINGENKVNFEREDIREFFPKKYTARQIEEAVIEILRARKEEIK